MWIFFIEAAGDLLSLCGWFVFHSFWLLAAGVVLVLIFDALMSSSGGQLKSSILSLVFILGGGIAGALTGFGVVTAALLAFSVYSAFIALMKLILLALAVMDRE